MQFSIEGGGAERLQGWRYFWLKYVSGFRPSVHCANCLIGRYEAQVGKAMRIGRGAAFELEPRAGEDYLYLCGVALRGGWAANFHLAFAPDTDARAVSVTSVGQRVTVVGARALVIPPLPASFRGLDKSFTTCRNFQFGVAYLEHGGRAREPVRQLPVELKIDGDKVIILGSKGDQYEVTNAGGGRLTCSCAGFFHRHSCRHVDACTTTESLHVVLKPVGDAFALPAK